MNWIINKCFVTHHIEVLDVHMSMTNSHKGSVLSLTMYRVN